MEPTHLLIAFAGIAAGGLMKGAVGAGAPIIGVPVLALIYDVPLAVAIFSFPNLLSNLWQGWAFRRFQVSGRFVWIFAVAGMVGVLAGTVLLATLSDEILMGAVGVMTLVYMALRLSRPDWVLGRAEATRLVGVAGFLGGILQGAAGVSAPVSVSFLNAMRMDRTEFIATISVFFAALSLVQVPALWSLNILTPDRLLLSCVAMVPLFGMMPVGAWLARKLSAGTFDKIILGVLLVLALRLLSAALL
ncbi:MAG: sulfite exporter TauE/SafE family protein [Qingshengfaniella sp.]